jgi:hypothetical protein
MGKSNAQQIRDNRFRRNVKPSNGVSSKGFNAGFEATKLINLYGSREKAKEVVENQISRMVYHEDVDAYKYGTLWFGKAALNQMSEISEAISRST